MPKAKKGIKIEPTKIKTIILAVVIAIVLTAFVIYLIQAIYPSPSYDRYCNINPPNIENMTQQICELNNGTWIPQNIQCFKAPCPQGYCDFYQKCNQEYQNSQDSYNLVVFMVAVIVGIVSVSAGIILALPSVSSGLMLGGAFLVFYGTITYWYKLSNWLRVIMLGVALAILIWLGYRKLKN